MQLDYNSSQAIQMPPKDRYIWIYPT